MKIFVLPGGSSPSSMNKYREAYRDTVETLRDPNPSAAVELMRYPGQIDEQGEGMGELTIGDAVDAVLEHAERTQDEIALFGICFGGIVGANLLMKRPERFARACFYAALPYWRLADATYLNDPSWTDGSRGVHASEKIVRDGRPFEELLDQGTAVDLRIAIGDSDTLVKAPTLNYYRQLGDRRFASSCFVNVPGGVHTMRQSEPAWREYAQICLGWTVNGC